MIHQRRKRSSTHSHRLFDNVCPLWWNSVLWIFLEESAQILQRRSKRTTDLYTNKRRSQTDEEIKRKTRNAAAEKSYRSTVSNLASVSPVDDLDSFLSCETVHVNLVGISTAMPLLLRPAVLKLYFIYPLNT